jgi:ribosomal protein S18 acetylase RimI-like enzyme
MAAEVSDATVRATVRECAPDDWELLRALRLAALRDTPDAFGSTIPRELELEEAEWRMRTTNSAIARCAGQPIGIAGCVVMQDTAELVGMWVAPEARRSGVGGALVEWAAERARTMGFGELRCSVAAGNEAAADLYRRCGFTFTGESEPMSRDSTQQQRRMIMLL